MKCKVLLFKVLGGVCLILFFTHNNYAQTAEWAPVINTSKTGGANSDGVFNNLTDNSWFNAANWNFTAGPIPASGLPDASTTVIIKTGTAPCYIEIQDPSVNDYLPRAKSITIENNAGLYNIAGKGLSLEARFLEITEDLTIDAGGTYIGGTEEIRVNRDFLNNGDFTVKQGENVIEVGRNYTTSNTARMSKETSFTNRKIIIDFRQGTNSIYSTNTGYDNKYTQYTNYSLTPGNNLFTDQDLFVTDAVDEMLVTKTGNATVTNQTTPATPIYVGVVTNNGDLEVSGTGNLTIISGSLIIKDVVSGTTAVGVADASTTHPRGYAWAVPNADINVRGNLTISDAGPLGSGNGASLDLFDTDATANSLCLYLGGDLFDENTEVPSNTGADRRGFYVGVSTITTNTNGTDDERPWLIMNGITSGVVTTQTIRGRATLLNDAADEGTEGAGILLPYLVILDNNAVTGDLTGGVETDNTVELASGARVVGDLTIYKNTIFNLLSNKLLVGDNPDDEINVFGTLKAETNAEFRMHDDVIIRGRAGGSVIISGTVAGPVFFSRGDTGKYRVAIYSGCYISVIYGDFFAMHSGNNDSKGAIQGTNVSYALTGTSATGNDDDHQSGGTNSSGGFKVYKGASLDPVNNFSYGRMPAKLTLNIDIPITANSPDDGSGDGYGVITIDNFFFGGGTGSTIVRNNRNGTIKMTNAIGNSAAAGVGEIYDKGDYSDTGDPDRIIWENNIKCIWDGGTSTSWNLAANWLNDAGGALGFVPGTTGNTAVDVIIPRNSTRDCNMDINNLNLEGTLRINFPWYGASGTNRTLSISSGVTLLQVGLDFMVDDNGTLTIHGDASPNQCRVEIGGTINFDNGAATFNEGTSILACVGNQRQRVTLRNEAVYTLEVSATKTGDVFCGGAVTCNGNLEVKGGLFRGNAGGADIRIKGDVLQTGGDIYPWNSDFFMEGNWLNTGGTMANAGNGSFNFEPNTTTTKQIQTNGQSFTTVIFNDKYSLGSVTQYDIVDDWSIITSLKIKNDCQLNIPDGLNGNFSTTNINNGGILNVVSGGTLAMEANETLTVKDGGKISIIGAADKYAKLTRQGATGRFTFDVEGTITARYYLIESMDANGVNLKSTAKSESPGVITYGGGGSGYTSVPDVTVSGGGGSGADFTAVLTTQIVTSYTKTSGGNNFTQTPSVIVTNGGGSGATGTAILTATTLDKVVVFSGGDNYNTGTWPYTVPGGTTDATVNVVVDAGGVITAINVTSAGAGYTATPTIDLLLVTGLGAAAAVTAGTTASIDAYLTATSVDQVTVPAETKYPVATFSDGIFTDGVSGGSFITIQGDYTNYRSANNSYYDGTSTFTSTLPTGVTHDYNATPRIDTIHNIVFPKNPGGTSYNFNRISSTSSAYLRIVVKNALGTFSGEDYDNEETIAAIAAGSPSNILNPHGIATTDSIVVWRTEGLKQWDGGPSSTGTSWSDAANWRPDGVPGPGDKVIISYDLLQLQWNVVNGPPDVVAPTTFTIDFDLDPAVQPLTCRSLTVESMLPDPNSGNTRKPVILNLTKDLTILENVVISSDVTINPNVGLTMKVGGSWNNDGSFNPSSSAMTVDFDQNFTRTVTNGGGSKFSTLIFTQGITDLGSDLYAEGDITIENGASLSPSNNNRKITLEGNWLNKGTFDPQQGTVQFGNLGSVTQTVTREPTNELQEFYSVIVKKVDGILQTGSRMQINSQLDIQAGKILTAKDKELIFGDNSNLPLVTTQSYIDGPCAHLYSDATTSSSFKFFPIGKDDTYIGGSNANRRIQLSVRSTNLSIPAGQFLMMIMEQFETAAPNRTIPSGSNANYVSRSRHWKVTQGVYPNTNSTPLQNGGTDVTIDKAKIQLAFDAGSERGDYTTGALASNPWLFGTTLEEITFAELGELTILKDSGTDKKGEGDGYPLITVTDGTPGSGAVIEPIITGDAITGMTITNGGSGYSMANPPIITIGGGGSENNSIEPGTGAIAAIATVDGGGAITGFTITAGGSGYNSTYPPTITVGASGAIGRATVAGGVITALEVTAKGTGYKTPTVVISGGSPTITATATATTDANGRITGFSITNGGTGYTVGSTEWTDAEGSISNINNNQFTVESTGPDPSPNFTFSTLGNGDFTLAWNFIALPIQFLELKAKAVNYEKVAVTWITNDEEQIARFEIQGSRDGGKTFETLGQASGKGNGRGVQNYEFIDTKPTSGINYYRLRQVDVNGLERFTKIITANIDKPITVKVTPNPVNKGEPVNIDIPHLTVGSTIRVKLHDIQGNTVKAKNISVSDQMQFTIPASAATGLYILKIDIDGKAYQSKLVVK